MFPYLMTGAAIAGGIYFTYQNCCKKHEKVPQAAYTLNVEDSVNSFDFSQMPARTQPGEQGSISTLYNALNATLVLFKNEDHLKEEGIFRLSGDLNRARSIHTIMRKMPMTYLEQTDPHSATSTLKIALDESFVPTHFATTTLNEAIRQSSKPKGILFKEHVQYLLDLGKIKEAYILHNLLYLFHRVYEFRAFNKMGSQAGGVSNIAIVLSPKFMKFLGMPEAVSLVDSTYNDNKAKVSRMIDELVIDPCFSIPFHDHIKIQTTRLRSGPR